MQSILLLSNRELIGLNPTSVNMNLSMTVCINSIYYRAICNFLLVFCAVLAQNKKLLWLECSNCDLLIFVATVAVIKVKATI